MKILITGGWGLVGGRLAQYLQTQGHEIYIASRFQRAHPGWINGARLCRIDWNDEASVIQAVDGMDAIIHTAAMNAQECANDPVRALLFNAGATAQLLDAAVSRSVKKFVYFSTAHVYNGPLQGQIIETSCTANLHPYATSHLAAEKTVLYAKQQSKIEGLVLRLSNGFGTPVSPDVNCWMLLVNELCKQAAETGVMQVNSSGLQYRDFVTLTEVCRITHALLNADTQLTTGCFNICSEQTITVLEMAKAIQQRCNHLGIETVLRTREASVNERHEPFSIHNTELKKLGLTINSDPDPEIDSLLLHCRNWFSRK